MDLDHIQWLVQSGEVRYTDKFDCMLQKRLFTAEQAHEAVLKGRIIDTHIKPKRKHRPAECKYIMQHDIIREGSTMCTLTVELAVTDEVIFISGYWPADSNRRLK